MRPRLSTLCLLFFATVSMAQTQYFHVAPGKPTQVRFESKARLERFGGKSDALSGWFALDPAALGTLSGELVLDLADLDTGLKLRNQHMRETVLHTDRHPTARLVLNQCEGAAKLGNTPTKLKTTGELTLHGVTRKIVADVEARMAGSSIAFDARFDVRLADFEIERPKMLMLKVAETVQVQIHGVATPGPAPKRTD